MQIDPVQIVPGFRVADGVANAAQHVIEITGFKGDFRHGSGFGGLIQHDRLPSRRHGGLLIAQRQAAQIVGGSLCLAACREESAAVGL
jgi:hypothetical protein